MSLKGHSAAPWEADLGSGKMKGLLDFGHVLSLAGKYSKVPLLGDELKNGRQPIFQADIVPGQPLKVRDYMENLWETQEPDGKL